jgi:hypothetical protein
LAYFFLYLYTDGLASHLPHYQDGEQQLLTDTYERPQMAALFVSLFFPL